MQQGYIRVYRSMLDKGWAKKPEYVAVWIYLLMRGNYKEKEIMVGGETITIFPGQFVTSRKRISEETGVNESKIQRILSCFESAHQIEQQTKSKYRVISIVNWDKYQQSEQVNEQQMNSKRTADEQQMNTDNKDNKRKKEKKDKNIKDTTPTGVSERVWADFVTHRKLKKAPITETALNGIIKEAEKAGIDLETALTECCSRGWQGFKASWYQKDKAEEKPSYDSTDDHLYREALRRNGVNV